MYSIGTNQQIKAIKDEKAPNHKQEQDGGMKTN
jgi:hypothetical protein